MVVRVRANPDVEYEDMNPETYPKYDNYRTREVKFSKTTAELNLQSGVIVVVDIKDIDEITGG